VRDAVGIIDQSSFAKFEVSGPGAEVYLDRLCANALPARVGGMALTQLCTERGGIECDITVTRLAEDQFYLLSAAATEDHDYAWLEAHLPHDRSVTLDNVSGRYGVLTIAGPASRELLAAVSDVDCSPVAFPFFTARRLHVGMAEALALRVSFVGELGYELHHAVEYQRHIYDELIEAGRELGAIDFGFRALDAMRLEKGYRLWGPDMSIDVTPLEAGMERWVRIDKGDFIGRDALERVRANGGPARRLACLSVDADGADAHGFEPVFVDGSAISTVTSGGFGHRVQTSIAFAYLPVERSAPGTRLEVGILGQRRPASVVQAPLYDPDNERLRS
jgi:dimethylglycine dehydrogenase